MNLFTQTLIGFFGLAFAVPVAIGQSSTAEPTTCISLNAIPRHPLDVSLMPRPPASDTIRLGPTPGAIQHFSKTHFLLRSAAVYAAATADMYQTTQVRNHWWWSETDPVAKPFVHLPTPAYYATGLVMATGVNWISWKMGHSRRFRRLAPLPQLAAIAGNLHGLSTNFY